MAWPHGTEANIGWLAEVGFANKYGRSLVSTSFVDSIAGPSDGLLTCLNLAADVEIHPPAHQLLKQFYAGHCADDLTTSIQSESYCSESQPMPSHQKLLNTN